MKLGAFAQFGTIIGMFVAAAVYLENRFDDVEDTMNRRFDIVDRRLNHIEVRLDKLEGEFHKLHTVVHNDLAWRYLYIHDPERKHLIPIYDSVRGTLEFIDKKTN